MQQTQSHRDIRGHTMFSTVDVQRKNHSKIDEPQKSHKVSVCFNNNIIVVESKPICEHVFSACDPSEIVAMFSIDTHTHTEDFASLFNAQLRGYYVNIEQTTSSKHHKSNQISVGVWATCHNCCRSSGQHLHGLYIECFVRTYVYSKLIKMVFIFETCFYVKFKQIGRFFFEVLVSPLNFCLYVWYMRNI